MRQRAKRNQFSLKIQCLPNAIDANGPRRATTKEASEEERALARDVAESFWTATKTGTDELQHEPKLYEIALKGLAVPDLPQEDCSPPPQLESLVFCVLLQVAPNY